MEIDMMQFLRLVLKSSPDWQPDTHAKRCDRIANTRVGWFEITLPALTRHARAALGKALGV
jgi:hypothetical protein